MAIDFQTSQSTNRLSRFIEFDEAVVEGQDQKIFDENAVLAYKLIPIWCQTIFEGEDVSSEWNDHTGTLNIRLCDYNLALECVAIKNSLFGTVGAVYVACNQDVIKIRITRQGTMEIDASPVYKPDATWPFDFEHFKRAFFELIGIVSRQVRLQSAS